MARELQYQGLAELNVLVNDTSKYSSEYFQVTNFPSVFTAGKNLFRFKGIADKFIEESDILIEVLDSNGQPIYYEADLNLESGEQSIIVAVYVDEETPPGQGEIILCGYLSNVISEEEGPTVRWSQPIDIDPTKQNDAEIIFSVIPAATVSTSSVVDSYTVTSYANAALVKSASINNFTYDYRNNGNPVIIGTVSTAAIASLNKSGSARFEVSRSKFTGNPSSIFTLTATTLSASVASYISTGSNIIFTLSDPFESGIQGSTQVHTFINGTGTTGSLYFDQTGSTSSSENTYTIISASFTNLQPQVGNIAKIRTFYKSVGVGEYVLASETDILDLATEFGYTPESASIIVPLPTVHRNDRFDLKFQFLNSAEAVSKQVLYVKDVGMPGGNVYIGGDDNLITGSVYVAGQTGTGVSIEGSTAGAFIRSVGYEGFQNVVANGATGQPGFIMYSGSVATMLNSNQTENYRGIGLELTAHSESYLRYTTSGSGLLDIRTNKFFLGSSQQYIVGADGLIQISSSNFFLSSSGDVIMAGTITATAGNIGGFTITSHSLSGNNFFISGAATSTGFFISASKFNVKGNGDVTGSNVLFTGGKIGSFTLSNDAFTAGSTFFISSSVGATPATSFFISASRFNVKQDGTVTGSSALFSGSVSVVGTINALAGNIGGFAITDSAITGSGFYLSGSATSTGFFISSSKFNVKGNGDVTGSNVLFTGGKIAGFTISNDTLSNGSNFYISGSATANDFFISSSKFNIKANGDVSASSALFSGSVSITGNVNARTGNIGGFNITTDAITGSGFYLSGSATGDNFFISSSAFNVKANGNITGSSVLFTGGKIGSFTLTNDAFTAGSTFFISSSVSGTPGTAFFISSSKFNVKQDGTITGSSALFSGSVSVVGTVNALAGNIGGFAITSDAITGSGFYLSGSATATGFFISSSKFNIKGNGDVTGSNVLFTGGKIGSFVLSTNALSGINSSTGATTFFISSSVDTTSPDGVAFFMSSSKFNVRQDGTISGSQVLFDGGKVGGFAIDSSKITGTNIIIDSSGSIQTADYASDLKGWKISAVDNGFAEFENVRVRGTLKTAVFEKETVNAVGGQLYVANSSTITGSEASSSIPDFVYLKFGGYSGSKAIQNIVGSSNTYLITSDLTTASIAAVPTTVQSFKPFGNTGLLIASGSKLANTNTGANIATISNINLDTSASFTVAVWVYPNFDNYTSSTPSGSIIEKTSANSSLVSTFGIYWYSGSNWPQTGSIRTAASNGTSNGTNTHVNCLPNKQWTHIAMAISGAVGVNTTRRFYINGQLVDSTNSYPHRSLSNTADIRLGAGYTYTERWPGYITDVRVYTGSLSTTQIASIYSGSYITASIDANTTALQIDNVTGFVNGEILSAKKVSNTGFATEYLQVRDTMRLNPSSDTDFSGMLYVTRSYGNGVAGSSGSLGDSPSTAQSYEPSQVIVSTGKLGTGFIRINANPNDQATPYIDIVERTGSGIYDVALKARLGDLSGLANSNYVFGNSNPGFGLATDNVFLQGGIIANTGSIGGIQMQNNKLYTGTGTFNNNNTGFYLDSNSQFSLGNKFSWNGTTLSVSGTLNATDGNIGGFTITQNAITGSGFYLSGSATNDGTSFFLSSSRFNIKGNGDITGSQVLFTGGTVGGFTLSSTQIADAGGSTLLLKSNGQITGSNVLFNGGKVGGFTISGDTLSNSTNFFISGSATGNNFFISSSAFNVKASGDVTASSALFSGSVSITGNVNARTGNIGGFSITANAITGSGFYLSGSASSDQFFISSSAFNVKANGNITGSSVLFTGGKIASFTLSNDAFTAGNTFFISSSVSGTPATAFFISSSRFNVKQDGTITGSNVLFNGGTIGGFTLSADKLSGTSFNVSSSGVLTLGSATSFTAGDGIYLSNASTNNFRVGDQGAARLQFDSTNLEIYNSSNTKLVSIGATNTIAGFTLSESTLSNGSSFFISGSSTGNGFFISASNFNVKANGDVTASNALFTGIATADIIMDKTLVLTAANSSSYLTTYDYNTFVGGVQNAYWLKLDGSAGGTEELRRVFINCELLYPLGKITFPSVDTARKIDIVIENGGTNQILDIFGAFKTTGAAPSVVDFPAGATITLTAVGTSPSPTDWNCIAGSYQPFAGYEYKRGLTISGSGTTSKFVYSGSTSADFDIFGGADLRNYDGRIYGSGSKALPTFSNIDDPDTGMYFPSTNTLAFVAGGTEQLKIDSNGATLPTRSAFRVIGNTSNVWGDETIISGSWLTVDYNQGNDWNNTTGVYTAPATGLYHVYFNARVNTGTGQVVIYKNTSTFTGMMWETTGTPAATHFGVSSVLSLTAGDTLLAQIKVGSIQFDSNDSWGVAFIG